MKNQCYKEITQKCLKAKTTISVFKENFLNNNNYQAR